MGYYDIFDEKDDLNGKLDTKEKGYSFTLLLETQVKANPPAVIASFTALVYHLLNTLNLTDKYDKELADMFFEEKACVAYAEKQIGNITGRCGQRPYGAIWSTMMESLTMEISAGNSDLVREFETLLRREFPKSCIDEKELCTEDSLDLFAKRIILKNARGKGPGKHVIVVEAEDFVPFYWMLSYGSEKLRQYVANSVSLMTYNRLNLPRRAVYTSLDRMLEKLDIESAPEDVKNDKILLKYILKRIDAIIPHVVEKEKQAGIIDKGITEKKKFICMVFDDFIKNAEPIKNSDYYYGLKEKSETIAKEQSAAFTDDMENAIRHISASNTAACGSWCGDNIPVTFFAISQFLAENKMILLSGIEENERQQAFDMALYSLVSSTIAVPRDISISKVNCIRMAAPENDKEFAVKLYTGYIINLLCYFGKKKDKYALVAQQMSREAERTSSGGVTEATKTILREKLKDADTVLSKKDQEISDLKRKLEEKEREISEKIQGLAAQYENKIGRIQKNLDIVEEKLRIKEAELNACVEYEATLESELNTNIELLEQYKRKEDLLPETELPNKKYLFIGGRYELIRYLKPIMQNSSFVSSVSDPFPDMEQIEKIFIFFNNISHIVYGKTITEARKHNIQVEYIAFKNQTQVMDFIRTH